MMHKSVSFRSLYCLRLRSKAEIVQDTDRELLPLMECFTSLAQALGEFVAYFI